MPRSIQEILDHADELAERFENYEPNDADERPVEEYLLERAVLNRARSEREVVDAVIAARAAGDLVAEDRQSVGHIRTGRPTALRVNFRIRRMGRG